MMPEKESID